MKKILVLLLLVCASASADVATIPGDVSARDVADWAIKHGHVGSGTLPASGSYVGERYTDLTDPLTPVDCRWSGTAWVPLGAGGDGSGGISTFTFNLHANANAAHGTSGIASTSALSAEAVARQNGDASVTAQIPLNASFTLSGLAEKLYSNLTGKPTNASWTITGLSDWPSMGGNAGKYLQLNATENGVQWGAPAGGTGGGVSTDTMVAYIATETSNRIASDALNQPIASMSLYQLVSDMSLYQSVASMSLYQLVADMTNYVATNTFTDHTGTNATHGCAAIASAAAIPNNASFTLAGLSERDYSSLTGTPTSAPWNGSATSNLDMGDGMAIQIATGTVANLSFRLRSDPDTGFFSDSANTIKIVCGGFTSLTLGNNSFAIGAATIALPSITGNIAQSANSFLIYGRVASSTQPTYSWYIDDCGLGRYAVGQPSMVAGGGIEAQRWTASGTQVYTNAIITPLGGTGIKLTASGTAAFTYGQVVTVGSITNGIFVVNPTDGQGPIGVVYGRVDLATSTVAIGSDAWIIVSGIAEVQGDAVGFGPGALVIAGSAGQGKDPGSIPPATQNEHNAEIGHAIGTGRAGTVGKVVLHFN